MRTILRFETRCGQGPCLGNVSAGGWFNRHYSKMNDASYVIPGFEPRHKCAIDIAGADYWLTEACLKDAEEAGLVLLVLTVTECLDEDAESRNSWNGSSYFWGSDLPHDTEGRPREFQVGFDPADIVECRTIKPTEYRQFCLMP